MTLTFDQLKFILPFAVSMIGAVYTFIATRRRDVDGRLAELRAEADAKIDALDDRADRHDQRLHVLETTVAGLPAKDDLHAVQIQLTTLGGHLERIEAHMSGHRDTMTRLTAVTDRLEDFLLKQKQGQG